MFTTYAQMRPLLTSDQGEYIVRIQSRYGDVFPVELHFAISEESRTKTSELELTQKSLVGTSALYAPGMLKCDNRKFTFTSGDVVIDLEIPHAIKMLNEATSTPSMELN